MWWPCLYGAHHVVWDALSPEPEQSGVLASYFPLDAWVPPELRYHRTLLLDQFCWCPSGCVSIRSGVFPRVRGSCSLPGDRGPEVVASGLFVRGDERNICRRVVTVQGRSGVSSASLPFRNVTHKSPLMSDCILRVSSPPGYNPVL